MQRLIMLCVLSGLLGVLAAFGLHNPLVSRNESMAQEPPTWRSEPAPQPQPGSMTSPAPPAAPAQDWLTAEERVNVFVYQQANRSVVNINTKGITGDHFLMFEIDTRTEGEGSGVVIDRAGHVLTNLHVVEGAHEVRVTLYDGKSYEARPVGGDPDTDVAVLKIEAPPDSLFPATLGSSTGLLVGQRVLAIGNPFGLERTLSTGIISSLNRSLPGRRGRRDLKSMIQIDAAINPGNSGGPLLDTHGRMIGMNTAIASKTGESTGVGFAIPVNTITRVVPQLIQNGRVRRPNPGIGRVYETEHGLLILTLVRGGPAERAGLQGPRIEKKQRRQGPFVTEYETINLSAADMIVAVDNQPIKSADDFLTAIEAHQPGDEVVITVVRSGQQRQVPLRLEGGE